ncbi:pyrophosphate-energized membrane proton pump 3 [Tanacetum coccineum]
MIHISNAIRDGAEGFFNTQYSSISKMALLLALLIFVIYIFRPQQDSLSLGSFTTASITVLSFLLGAVCSVLLSSLPHSMFAWESTHLAPSRLLISPPCLPDLSPQENFSVLGSMQLGKYTEWFNDVFSPEISTMCEDILNLLLETHGCKINSLSFNPLNELLMATGSTDKTLKVFDMRNLTSELYTLQVSQISDDPPTKSILTDFRRKVTDRIPTRDFRR